VERSKRNCGRISVFKGREAKLNRAVFQVLALKGPQTIYEAFREVKAQKGLRHTKYTNVNRRVRTLEEYGYIEKVGARKTQAGFQAALYQLTARTYLAIILDQIDLNDVLQEADRTTVQTLLAVISSILY
jgi:chromosome segregation and condensation protein ScpB